MKLISNIKEDCHVHSFNYSDGLNTIEELVIFAGKIGMKKLIITDHSQATLETHKLVKKCVRNMVRRWKNVHNKVDVKFGIEADLLNEKGEICDEIQGKTSEFIILSYHPEVYRGNRKKVTEGYVKAIERHYDKIKCIGHPYAFPGEFDWHPIVEAANKHHIPIELNCKYLMQNKELAEGMILEIIKSAELVMVNSDSHTLAELRDLRKEGYAWLKRHKLI